MTPDMLHQVWQGVIRSLTSWLMAILGKAEFDARVKCLPLNHLSRHFHRGVSGLSQMSGREHRELAKILLAITQGVPNLSPKKQISLSAATRGLIDFAYISMYKQHDETTLKYLQNALDLFHEHKWVFTELKLDDKMMDFPKLHSLQHYIDAIRLIGVTGGVSTEESEHAHIINAKLPWAQTNKRDALPQMVLITERNEKLQTHENYIIHTKWLKDCSTIRKNHQESVQQALKEGKRPPAPPDYPEHPFTNPIKAKRKWTGGRIQFAVTPPRRNTPISLLPSSNTYQATHFVHAMKDFIYRRLHPNLSASFSLSRANNSISLGFDQIDLYDQISFHNPSITGIDSPDGLEYDVIHAKPWQVLATNEHQAHQLVNGRQDTCLIQNLDPVEHPGFSSKWF